MTVGLAGLLYFLDPTGGRTDQVPLYVWIIGIGANLAPGRGALGLGPERPGWPGRRPRRQQ